MVLHICDVSQYIYGGSYKHVSIARGVREVDGMYQENWAPIGGVRFLINRLAELSGPNNIVIPVFDRTPTVKREMYYKAYNSEFGYKGTRKSSGDNAIAIQKKYAYDILQKIGYPVQAAEGYEADDVIYTLVQMYKNDFDEIRIHCNDSDLYFLIGGNVMMDTIGPNIGKVITERSYPQLVDTKEGGCPYNAYHMRKLCNGDKSDNIPGIGKEWLERLDSVIPKEKLCELGDLDVCRDYLKKVINKYPDAPNSSIILSTFNILMPLRVPEFLINDAEPMIDYQKQAYFVSGWVPELDRWGFEDDLEEYINSYYQ